MNRTLTQLTRAAAGTPPDAQLLAEFVARHDGDAFALLVRRHGPMVFAACRRVLRHQQDAEDAFQATFLVLARRAGDVWPGDAVGAWLHGVAYRVAMKARGTRAKVLKREHPLEDVPFTSDPPCPDLADVLDRAIRKLPEAYRAAVVACDLEGRTRKDAAELLGWKEGTLSGRLARARQLLAARLKKAGLAGALPVAVALPSELMNRVIAAGGERVGVSAPVAALTEGVVRSMFLTKLKTASAAVLVVCALGLGVWSAAGQGPGESGGGQPPKRAAKPAAKEPSDLERFQGEWIIGRRYLENNASLPNSVVAATLSAAKKDGTLILVEGPRMTWPLFELAASGTTTGSTGGGGAATTSATTGGSLLICPRHYTITLDATASPKHFDLTDQYGAVRKGIYKFEDGYFVFVLNEKGGRPKGFDSERVKDDEPMWTLWQPRKPEKKAAPAPPAVGDERARSDRGQAQGQLTAEEIESRRKEAARRAVVAASDVGVRNLQGRWRVDLVWTDAGVRDGTRPGEKPAVWEFSGTALRIQRDGITTDFTFSTNSTKSPAEIDILRDGVPVSKGVFDTNGSPVRRSELRLTVGDRDTRPASIVRRAQVGVTTFELSEILPDDPPADRPAERKRAQAQRAAEEELAKAQTRAAEADIEVAAARRRVDELLRQRTPAASFAYFVRTPLAAETTETVSLAAAMTVLDVFDTYKVLNDLRATAGLTVWIARDGKVLPVDIVGITRNGVANTNYQMKAGDKLFVQVNTVK